MNCLIYARVSTERQAEKELSIPAQLQACRQYASQRDWVVIEEIIEPGISARTTDRPGLRSLLSRCRSTDPVVHMVLVHKIDRLTRNLADHVAIRGVLKERQIRLASVVEQLDESNSGILVEHIMASLAEFYSANLSEEVKKGLRQKIQSGGWPHLPPIGYRAINRQVTVDPQIGPVVRRAFELYGRGNLTLQTLKRRLEQDGHGFSISALQRLLRNPFYKGELRWKGGDYPGRHEPLVTSELFDEVQIHLNGKTRRRLTSPKCNLWLRGFARCAACSSLMSSESHPPFDYYRCRRNTAKRDRCRARFCNARRMDAAVLEIYRQITLTPPIKRFLGRALATKTSREAVSRERERQAVQHRLTQIERRAIDLATNFADGLIDNDLYRLTAARINEDRQAFIHRLRQLPAVPAAVRSSSTASTLAELHSELTPEQQQDLLTIVFSDLRLQSDSIQSYEFLPPFDVLISQDLSTAA